MVMTRELERFPRHTVNNIRQWPECLLLAQSGHSSVDFAVAHNAAVAHRLW
jgi:hypothetical protein